MEFERKDLPCKPGCCAPAPQPPSSTPSSTFMSEPIIVAEPCKRGCCDNGKKSSPAPVPRHIQTSAWRGYTATRVYEKQVVATSPLSSCSKGCCGGVDKAQRRSVKAPPSPAKACSKGCCGGDDEAQSRNAAAAAVKAPPSPAKACSKGCCGGDNKAQSRTAAVAAVKAPPSPAKACSKGCCGNQVQAIRASVPAPVPNVFSASSWRGYTRDGGADDAKIPRPESAQACSKGCCGGDSKSKRSAAAVAADESSLPKPAQACAKGCCDNDLQRTACSNGCSLSGDGNSAHSMKCGDPAFVHRNCRKDGVESIAFLRPDGTFDCFRPSYSSPALPVQKLCFIEPPRLQGENAPCAFEGCGESSPHIHAHVRNDDAGSCCDPARDASKVEVVFVRDKCSWMPSIELGGSACCENETCSSASKGLRLRRSHFPAEKNNPLRLRDMGDGTVALLGDRDCEKSKSAQMGIRFSRIAEWNFFDVAPMSRDVRSYLAPSPPRRQRDHAIDMTALSKGAELKTAKTILFVSGLCCASEVAIVEAICASLPGVKTVRVNIMSKECTVFHDPATTTAAAIAIAMNRKGLGASVSFTSLDGDGTRKQVVDTSSRLPKWNVTLALLCWLASMLAYICNEHDNEVDAHGHDHSNDCHNPGFAHLKYAALVSIALVIPRMLQRSWASLRQRVFDINALMVLAALGAIAIAEYQEGAAVLTVFALSGWLEEKATARARSAVASIVALRPDTATLASGETVPVEGVATGTLVSVRPGDKVPLDGIVQGGSSVLDESSLTGEDRPVKKSPGDAVSAGTLNVGGGHLTIKSTSLSVDSAVSRLVALVEQAQMQRSPTEQLVQKIAKVYTPIVVLCAVMLCTVPWAWGNKVGDEWFYKGLNLLVVACPCALVISTPITYVCGMAHGAKRGILVKGGQHLETLGKIKAIGLDKTGTCTEGLFAVRNFVVLPGANIERPTLLRTLASIEQMSTHPLAAALCDLASSEGAIAYDEGSVADFYSLPGEGVGAVVNGTRVLVGNRRLAERLGWTLSIPNAASEAMRWEEEGMTVGWMAMGNVPVAVFAASDAPREHAAEAIAALRLLGVRPVMLTGDNAGSAEACRAAVGMSKVDVHAGLLPEDKVSILQDLKKEHAREGATAFCGDGVNDAPALAAADVSLAMGATGTVVAMETADVALMDTDLRKLAKAIRLGKKTTRKIKENVIFSFVLKLVMIALTVTGHSQLWLAVLADVGSMLIVTLNGMTLLGSRGKKKAAAVEISNV